MDIHATGLLSTLVVSLVVAFAGGMVARSLHLPPLVGYLIAGIAVGPFTPGFVADQKIANELADIGVALLLFSVGLHFSPADLWRVRRIVIPGALVQIPLTAALGFAVSHGLIGLPASSALIIGLCLSIASTAVATCALADRGRLDIAAGRIALGWLVVQDIVVVIALVIVPVMFRGPSGGASAWVTSLGQVALQIAGFVAVMYFAGRRAIPWLLDKVARIGSRELFTLAVIVTALGIASASTLLFGISLALGAFVAGVVLGESTLSHQAAAETLSMQQVFTVLFFVSIGMLFDPMSIVRMPLEILAMLVAIIIGAGLSTLVLLLVLRCSVETAALVGAAFAQIGEFSFILSELAVGQGILDTASRDLVLASALLAILINTPVFRVAAALAPRVAAWPPIQRWRGEFEAEAPPEPVRLSDHAILIGHGRVGSIVARALEKHRLAYAVIETDRTHAENLREQGKRVIYGDGTRAEVLNAAATAQARLLLVALPDAFHARAVIAQARKLNPAIATVVRTHSQQEATYLEAEAGVGLVVMGEKEVALSMSDFALQQLGVSPEQAQVTVNNLR